MVADLTGPNASPGAVPGAAPKSAAAPDHLAAARRVVVKVGSALLVGPDGRLRADWLRGLIEDVAMLAAEGKGVALVSSGSIALGRGLLGLPSGPLELPQSQAAAAVGQIALARAYADALASHSLTAAQVLLTLDDTNNRRRYLNAREALEALLSLGAVPVANENDTVATDEIRYGDNDRLAARTALMCGAGALVLLSDIDGLYTANPKTDSAARHLPYITEITPEIEAMAGEPTSGLSKGGMKTKIMAAKTAAAGGCAMAIALGETLRPISALRAGAPCTWFAPSSDPENARKQWISAQKPMGALIVDAGAAAALARGGSLLPAGVRGASGVFDRGDAVRILCGPSDGANGEEVGVCLAAYGADDVRRIAGRQSSELASILGYPARPVVAHRDEIVVWNRP